MTIISIRGNDELIKKCHILVKFNNGIFRNDEIMATILDSKYDQKPLQGEFGEEVDRLIKSTDLAVIQQGWREAGESNNAWNFAFIVDNITKDAVAHDSSFCSKIYQC